MRHPYTEMSVQLHVVIWAHQELFVGDPILELLGMGFGQITEP